MGKNKTKLRQQAESVYQQKSEEYSGNDGDLHKINEELRVHQIELELQNEELRQAQLTLEKSRDQFYNLYELAPVGYLTLNSKGMIQAINMTGTDLLGVVRDKLLRTPLTRYVEDKDTDLFYHWKQSCLEQAMHQKCELQLKQEQRDDRWVQLDGIRQRSDEEDPQLWITMTDITESKQAEEKHRELERELFQSQKMETIGVLAGGIAHDFNNLLVPILGMAQYVQKRLGLQNEDAKHLGTIIESANRAKELVERILLFSRKTPLQTQPVQLKSLVDEVLTLLKASLPKKIDIHHKMDFDLPLISADPSQIHQVVVNLCNNAAQAMPEGGDLKIRLKGVKYSPNPPKSESSTAKDFVCLSVQDTGYGMDAEIIERIYEPFYTTKTRGEQRGTGLGLSIVYSIVEKHHGHIELESQVGVGTTFQIFFPVSTIRENPPVEEVSEIKIPTEEIHVLLVDDEPLVKNFGEMILKDWGYQVTSFTDPQEALQAFKKNTQEFHLVLTDYSMPHLSGVQLAEKIKAIHPNIPILMMTGYTNLATDENIQKWHCDGTVTKPYDIDKLRQTIMKVIENAKS